MQNQIQQLETAQITSEVFIISQAQIDFIATKFGDAVADAMNMRAFSNKIRVLAANSLRDALISAKKSGIKQK